MTNAQTMEGTWEELATHAEEFRGKKLRLTIVSEESASTQDRPQSLADLLGDFLGCIEGSGANNSEDTGQKFTAFLVKKHEENHL